MRLTPLDIRKQEFTRAFRGYDPEEVHAFLQMVSNQWDEILDDSRRKDEKIRELQNKMEHYEKVEEALQEALQTARETSRKALQNAEDKAKLIVEEAERRADDIKRDAEQDRHQIKRETAKLSGRRSEIVTRLRAFLMSEMELLARYEGDDPVGFIKLLPAEEQRLHQLTSEARSRAEGVDKPEATAPEPQPQPESVFAPTPIEDVHDEDVHEEDVHTEEPDEADDEIFEEEEIGEEADFQPQEEDRPEPAGQQKEEVMHGPGWTARTVISRPSSEQAPSTHQEDVSEYDDEEEEETSTRASSDEIEKIRRILSDLD